MFLNLICFLITAKTYAVSIQEEPLLYTADIPTATLLPAGSWIYNYPPPVSPGWMWWGFSDNGLMEIDIEAWLGGVPSINVRLAVYKDETLSIAYENMFQYVSETINLVDDAPLGIVRQYSNWYHHINASFYLYENLYLHAMLGGTYSGYLRLEEPNTIQIYEKSITPDAAIGLDWRPLPWLAVAAGVSYGSTFSYVDNAARKQQISLAFLLTPFYKINLPILSPMRINLSFISMKFQGMETVLTGPVAHIYWLLHLPKLK